VGTLKASLGRTLQPRFRLRPISLLETPSGDQTGRDVPSHHTEQNLFADASTTYGPGSVNEYASLVQSQSTSSNTQAAIFETYQLHPAVDSRQASTSNSSNIQFPIFETYQLYPAVDSIQTYPTLVIHKLQISTRESHIQYLMAVPASHAIQAIHFCGPPVVL